MSYESSRFTPYLEDTFGEELTPGSAERTADLTVSSMEHLRQQFPFETITTEPGLSSYIKKSEQNLRYELDGRPKNSSEHMVASAYHVQRAAVIEAYLNNTRGLPDEVRNYLEVDRNTAYAEAQQSVVSVLLAESDPRVMREAALVYSAVWMTPWNRPVKDMIGKMRQGTLNETQQERLGRLTRGVAGHAAGVRLATSVFDHPSQAYAPSAELDGKHGIDFGLRGIAPEQALIDTVVQVKGKEKLERSINITPVAGDPNQPYTVAYRRGDIERLPPEERLSAERELSIRHLDSGTARLRRDYGHLVDKNLVGLFLELKAAPAGQSWDRTAQSSAGQFDIFTGLCNDALLAATEREYVRIAPDVKAMRQVIQRSTLPRRPRPLHRQRLVH